MNISPIEILTDDRFKTIPWKNGKGTTLELAINDGGTVDEFDWRLSIALVSEDGAFSDFSGYWRNLVLLEGEGIDLNHDQHTTDELRETLEFTTFDGGSETIGKLVNGAIKDFNIMTKQGVYIPQVSTFHDLDSLLLDENALNFIYALEGGELVMSIGEFSQKIPCLALVKVDACTEEEEELGLSISGRRLIVISLYKQD